MTCTWACDMSTGDGAGRTGARAPFGNFSVNVKSFQNKTFNWKKTPNAFVVSRKWSRCSQRGRPALPSLGLPSTRLPHQLPHPAQVQGAGCGQGQRVWRLPQAPSSRLPAGLSPPGATSWPLQEPWTELRPTQDFEEPACGMQLPASRPLPLGWLGTRGGEQGPSPPRREGRAEVWNPPRSLPVALALSPDVPVTAPGPH